MSEYIVDRLGQLGDGIIDTPNGEIFAPFTLPGEHIEGNVENGRVNSPKIIKPVSDRIKPACKHFKSCGGCSLQHASDTVISDWKIRKTQDALSQVNLHPEFRPIINSKAGSRRRATFAAKRTKKGALVGFHGRASDVIIEISECPISDPILLSGMPAFSQFAIQGSSRKAVLRISATVSGNSLDVKIDNGKKLSATEISKFAQICNQFKILRLMWNDDVIAQSNPPSQKMGLADVIPPSGAFLQATKSGEAALVKTVLEIIGPSKRVVDLFAGCGTFALPISSKATVHAFEGDVNMIAALDSGWRAAGGLHDIKSETRDLFRRPLMPDEFKKIDAIVIDPPRAGAVSQVVEIAKANVGRIAFVSCNPATFARDASILCNNGYNLDWVQVIDQFLWNPHIELVAQFTKINNCSIKMNMKISLLRNNLYEWLSSAKVRYSILTIIILNAVILGMETSPFIMNKYGTVLSIIDNICLAIFVIELTLKLFSRGLRFFRDPWNLFDFFVIAISLAPLSEGFSVLRALRILRVLRALSFAPRLRRTIEGFISALPGMSSVIILMAIIFYIGAVIATKLFAHEFPIWFGSIGKSLYSLFQIMTLESWSMGIVRPVMEVYPFAWMFFVPFILITSFAVVNVLVGLIVNSMHDAHSEEATEATDAYRDDVINQLNEISKRLDKIER